MGDLAGFDPVEVAEKITRFEALKDAMQKLDGLHQPYIPPVVGPKYVEATKRLSALRRAEERAGHDPLPRLLRRLLGAIEALRRGRS